MEGQIASAYLALFARLKRYKQQDELNNAIMIQIDIKGTLTYGCAIVQLCFIVSDFIVNWSLNPVLPFSEHRLQLSPICRKVVTMFLTYSSFSQLFSTFPPFIICLCILLFQHTISTWSCRPFPIAIGSSSLSLEVYCHLSYTVIHWHSE